MPSNLAFTKEKSSCFTPRNNSSKGIKNSECLMDLGFNEKLRPLLNHLKTCDLTRLIPLKFLATSTLMGCSVFSVSKCPIMGHLLKENRVNISEP